MTERGVCDLLVISWGCDMVGDATSSMVEDMITGLATAIFGLAVTVVGWVWSAIDQTTTPATDADWLYEWAGRIFGITLPITVGLLILQVATTVLRTGGGDGVGRAVARAGVAVFGTAVSLPVIHLLTSAVDGLGEDLTAVTFGEMNQIGDRLQEIFALVAIFDEATGGLNFGLLGGGSVVAGAVAFIIFGVLLVLGALAVWGALLVRSMLLHVVIVMGPIAIMGLAWEYTRGWFKAWVAVVNALVWTKLAVMVVFGLGVSAIAGASWGDDGPGAIGVLLSGALMMLMAALVPLACYSFMSFVGDEVHASVLHRGGVSAAAAGRDAVTRANPARVLQRVGGAGAATDGGSEPGTRSGDLAQRTVPTPPTGTVLGVGTPHADGDQAPPSGGANGMDDLTATGSPTSAGDDPSGQAGATEQGRGGADAPDGDALERPPQTGWWTSRPTGRPGADAGSAAQPGSADDPGPAPEVDARGERGGGIPRPARPVGVDDTDDEVLDAQATHAADRLRAASSDTDGPVDEGRSSP